MGRINRMKKRKAIWCNYFKYTCLCDWIAQDVLIEVWIESAQLSWCQWASERLSKTLVNVFSVQQMLCNAFRCDAMRYEWIKNKPNCCLSELEPSETTNFDDNICKNLPIKWAHCCCAVWKSMNSKMTPTGHCFSGFAHGLATISFTFCFIRVLLCAGSAWHSSQFERQTTTNANC